MEKERWHCWRSQQAIDEGCNSTFWAREDGTEVEVTMVSKTDSPEYGWPDAEYRGLVVRYARDGVPRRDGGDIEKWSRVRK